MFARYPTVLTVAAALLLAGCAHRERAAEPATSPPAPSPTSVSSTPVGTSTQLIPPPVPSTPAVPRPHHVLADGRYPAFLTAIDVPARTITFDVIQYLTGEAAEQAFREDNPEAGEGPPNGFYIRNLNPRLRTLPVRPHVTARVVWLGGTMGDETIPFEQLPAYLADDPIADQYLWYAPFWLTLHNDRIVSIEEQYLP